MSDISYNFRNTTPALYLEDRGVSVDGLDGVEHLAIALKRPVSVSGLDDQRWVKADVALPDNPPVLGQLKLGLVVIHVLQVDDEVGRGLLAPTICGCVGQAGKTVLRTGNCSA